MPALCKCPSGHVFLSRLVADEPDVNYIEVEDSVCPECGSEEFEITEILDRCEDVE